MKESKYPHPPGHPKAVIDGCLCPIMDNGHGKGCGYIDDDGLPLFIFSNDCPLHGSEPTISAKHFRWEE